MPAIEALLLIILAGGLLTYLVSRLNKTLGMVLTILVSGFAFISVASYAQGAGTEFWNLPLPSILTFELTDTGLFFAVIVTFVFFMVSFFNPYYVSKLRYPSAYGMLFLFALAGSIGVFMTDNMLALFFFFELVVWSSMFLIPMSGAKKPVSWYYGFSALGSFSLLVALLLIYGESGSFDLYTSLNAVSGVTAGFVYTLLVIAGLSKLGGFPVHIWLPRVLGQSPDPVTSVFSGGLEKMGAFVSFLVLVRLTPIGTMIDATGLTVAQYVVATLGALSIVFGTLMAIKQDDAKKLLAYSSMSNGGYIVLAFSIMSTMSVAGGLYHVMAHALASAAAYLAIGAVNRQTGTTKMSELGGMIHKMPLSYLVYLIAIISMAGIPPMGGFISKWLIYQALIGKGLVLLSVAAFFGSIGSFLYVFRPLAALFLGQELPQFKKTIKEAPFFMALPMVILSLLNIATGVVPTYFLEYVNMVMAEAGLAGVPMTDLVIHGTNGDLHAALISGTFAVGVGVAFIIFILLKKSYKVGLMDTYTAANFIYTEELLHYSVNFYAPLERLYDKYTNMMKDFYDNLANKVREIGAFFKYFLYTYKPEITVLWIVLTLIFLLWGDIA